MITKFQSDLSGRQRYLAFGRHYADAIAQIRERGLDAALEAVACMGGATQRKGIARGLVKSVEKIGTVPAFRITGHTRRRFEDGATVVDRIVEIPSLTWHFKGRQQVGVIEWLPIFSATDRRGAPALWRPLP